MPTRPSLASGQTFLTALAAFGLVAAILASGCSRKYYEDQADRQTYRILQQVEHQVFGRTNAFSIDTAYSGRDPNTILPDEILENRTATNRRVVHLEEALDLAVRTSREYQTQKEQLYLAALSLTGARYEFSPQFLANFEPTIRGSPEDAQFGLGTQVGVSQLLRTGGRLSVSLANDLLRYFTGVPIGVASRDSAINLISVNLSQPLLRGFGRNSPEVENLTQAERDVVYAIRSFSQYQRQFAVDTVNAYFGLLRQKDTVRNNYTNYLRRAYLTSYTEARAVDRASSLQVGEARSQELTARISYVNSIAAYLNGVAAFKFRLGLPQSEDLYLDDTDLRDLAEAGLVPAEIERGAAFQFAVERHMDILNAIDRFEDTKRKLRLAADRLKPGILLSGSASLASDAPYDYANFDLDELRYSAGVAIELPVDRLRERNTYRAALVSFESQIRTLGQTLDAFKRDIEDGLRTLEQQRLNYLSRQEELALAMRREENSRLSYEAGRAEIRDVRDAQDALITAQNSLTFTLVDYLQVRLGLLLDIGALPTEEPQFWLKDPLDSLVTPEMRGPPPLQMPRDELIPPHQFLEPQP